MMTPKRIRSQLQLLALAPAMIMLFLLLAALTWQRFDDAEQDLRAEGNFLVRHLAASSEYGVLSGNYEDLRSQARLALQNPAVRYVLFRDASGKVLLYQGARGNTGPLSDGSHENLRLFRAGIYRQLLPLGDKSDSGSDSSQSDRVRAPQLIGQVTLALSDASVAARQREIVLTSLGPALAAILVGLWIAGRMTRGLSRPIAELSRLVRMIRGGDYHIRSSVPLRGELAELQTDINELAAALERARSHQEKTMSELREERHRAEVASQAKSDFLAMMSHELRTPMNGVLGMMQLLQETEMNTEQEEYARAAVESISHLLEVINDILDFSRIEAGRMETERLWFRPRELVRNAVANFRFLAEQKGLQLLLDGDGALEGMQVCTDPTRLRQILGNLISNAVKFTDEGRVRVLVEVEHLQDDRIWLHLSVEDTGIGIPRERLPELFQAFSQVDSSTSRRFGGTGLGLAIARQLTQMLGGTLEVDSVSGQGTRFDCHFLLPVRQDVHVDTEQKQVAELPQLHGRVLLVEDNQVNRLVAERMLIGVGVEVTCAENGDQALEYLQEESFDCVLMDLQMPVMDGLEATRIWRRQEERRSLSRTPIIALTANAMPNERTRCLAAGMDDYLAKPFQRKALIELVARYLSPSDPG